MATYNGHKNYNYWNVSLWINNDEGLYKLAQDCVKMSNKEDAAALFVFAMQKMDMPMTPDGVKWSVASVKAAMEEM